MKSFLWVGMMGSTGVLGVLLGEISVSADLRVTALACFALSAVAVVSLILTPPLCAER